MNTADLLLANLERLLSSPTSAETIRKLIFDLAIRGKLSIQSDKDEPASALIAKVIRTAQAEDRKFSAEPAVTEKPFEVPSGWEWVRLGNTGKIFNGTSASAGEKVRLSKTTDGLPFIATKDVGYGREPLCYENGLKVPHGDKDYKVAKSGAVLICAEGGSAGKKIGQTDRLICFGNKLYANETWDGIEPRYILSLYQSNFFYAEFKAKMAGIIGGITRSDFRSLRIPLPPLAEQKRIVAKVDELMALCDRLEAQLKERDVKQAALAKAALAKFTEDPTPANLQLLFHTSFSIEPDDIKTCILSLALNGRLCRQIASEGTATKDLSEAGVDIKKWKVDESERRYVIPSSWTWLKFGGAGDQRLGKMLDEAKNTGELKPYLRNTSVQWMRFNLEDVKLMRIEKEDQEELRLRKGDLLICEGGQPGRCAIWEDNTDEMYFQKALHRVRPCCAIDSRYLAMNLRYDCTSKVIDSLFTGATIKHLTGRSLSAYSIPVPPHKEQLRIIEQFEGLMNLVNSLEAQLEASRTTGEKLLEAMVAELTAAR